MFDHVHDICSLALTVWSPIYIGDVGRIFDDAWLVESRVSVPVVERKW